MCVCVCVRVYVCTYYRSKESVRTAFQKLQVVLKCFTFQMVPLTCVCVCLSPLSHVCVCVCNQCMTTPTSVPCTPSSMVVPTPESVLLDPLRLLEGNSYSGPSSIAHITLCVHVCVCVHVHVHVCVCTCVCTCVCVCVCMYVCTCSSDNQCGIDLQTISTERWVLKEFLGEGETVMLTRETDTHTHRQTHCKPFHIPLQSHVREIGHHMSNDLEPGILCQLE